jgi:hypothetical protein
VSPILDSIGSVKGFGFGALVSNIGVASFESIATTTLSSAQSTITFSSVPSTYKHLQIRAIARDAGGNGEIKIEFNGDTTTTNYRKHVFYGNGSSAFTGQANNNTCTPIAYSSQTAGVFEVIIMDILDYANTNKNTTIKTIFGKDTTGSGDLGVHSNLWVNTAAVSQIDFKVVGGSNFAQYTQFALYGIKGA